MKLSEVLETDMKMFGQLINMLQAGEYSLNGKDLCASADTIRWLQKVAVDAAGAFSASKASGKSTSGDKPQKVEKPVLGPTDKTTPSSPLGEGVSLKSFGKAKK